MNRACPVVLRIKHSRLELLAFERPNAGSQLVKGGLKKGESLESACVRELEEESGIQAEAVRSLGVWKPESKNQVWGFCLMHYEGRLPDAWAFDTKDDGGQRFRFFWQPLDRPPGSAWSAVYRDAFQYIKAAVANLKT